MSILNLVSLLGGLALFLYGIALMGDGLNKVAGSKLQMVLYSLTSNPIKGILLGIGVTALIQSSSATSIMAIGFVNSGLMEFAQAVSIILGSIVGTSVTGWIVSLSSIGAGGGWTQFLSTTFITGVVATVGIVLFKFSKRTSRNHVGAILLGFAILMYGMNAMSSAVTPLRENEAFIGLLTTFSNPVLGVLVGMVFTAIIQSSAAAVGILQALSMTGALPFSAAYPILLGIAVGGALPVLISALGASVNAQRTAVVHLVIDVLGALICGVVFYAVNAVAHFGFMETMMTPVSIAALNTVFRAVTVVLLTPAIGLLEKIARFFVRDPKEQAPAPQEQGEWELLDERFMSMPSLAIEQGHIAVSSMARYTQEGLDRALNLLWNYSDEEYRKVASLEQLVDQYEDRLGTYLVKVSSLELTEEQNESMYESLHAITDLERISDHALSIAKAAREISEKGIEVDAEMRHEMDVMHAALREVVGISFDALVRNDDAEARMVEPLEELIDNLCDEMKHRHVERVRTGSCALEHSFVFNDLITVYERVSDHCSNLAVAMIELEHESFDTHHYIESLMSRKDEQFSRYFEQFKAKYSLE